jgi:hypothetical protein
VPAVGGRAADVVDGTGGARDELGKGRSNEPETRLATGAAEPNAAHTEPRSRSTRTASDTTAITIAFRGPTFMNVSRTAPTRTRAATISSSDSSALRFTPSRKSSTGSVRLPRTLATSTSPSATSNGGSASPAGEAVPRFPPIVPRFRICGEPTVREASARAGKSSASSPCIASV